MNPYAAIERIGLYLALIAAIFFAGLYKGYHYEKGRWQEASDKAQAEAFSQYKADAEKIANLSAQLAAAQAKTNTVFKTITNEVTHEIQKPIYSQCVLDVTGVRLWNDSNAGRNSAPTDTDKPVTIMPNATGFKKSINGIDATKSR